jgi:heme exporter protein A
VTDYPAIDLEGIVHRYGRSYVLRGVSLKLKRGETLALYGSNGSGKTTLLRIIATSLSPTRGEGSILGFPLSDRLAIRENTLLVSHALGLYPDLSGVENLAFTASLHGRPNSKAALEPFLERVRLGGVTARVRGYSSGMRKRLALAKLLMLEPELALLDEPFAALDPEGKAMVLDVLREQAARGTTLVVASHEPELTNLVATQAVTLSGGVLPEPAAVAA